MRFQVFIQIALLIIAIVIAVTVIRPKLADMQATQAETNSYKTALDNIDAYNRRLQALTTQVNAISADRLASLDRFLPEDIDPTVVARDISNIVEQNNMLMLDITESEPAVVSTTVGKDFEVDSPENIPAGAFYGDIGQAVSGLVAHQFTLSMVGNYKDLKTTLADFERNIYPLRVVEFNFDAADSDLVSYRIVLETYSLPASTNTR